MPEPRSIIAERGIRGMPRERKSNIFAKEITLYVQKVKLKRARKYNFLSKRFEGIGRKG